MVKYGISMVHNKSCANTQFAFPTDYLCSYISIVWIFNALFDMQRAYNASTDGFWQYLHLVL